MKYDELLQKLGEFGRYQKFQYFLVCLVSVSSAWHSMNMVFVGATQGHYCAGPEPEPAQWQNLTDAQKLNLIVPAEERDGEDGYARCSMYNESDVVWTEGNYTMWLGHNRTQHQCEYGWSYSQQFYKTTIVSEWDLVCSNAYQRNMASTIFFAGRLVGAFVSGELSDKFGRRTVFFVALGCQVVFGCVVAVSPWLWFFYVFYFLQGVAQVAVYLSSYVIGMEVVGPKYRKLAGMFVNIFYAFGQMTLVGIAYGLKEWRHIELAISLPVLLFFSYYWLVPESIRWLPVRGEKKKASEIIRLSAKINKVTLTDDVVDQLEVETNTGHVYSVLDTLKTWKFAKVALNIWFNWLVNAMVYYGLNLNTENLHGDPYMNFFIAGCVEIPGVLLALALLDITGRRWLMFIFMVIGGAGCISSAFIPTHLGWLATTLSMIGKLAITASYAIIYLLAAEVFPTVVRNSGMGFASVCARIGGMVAPQILLLRNHYSFLPLLLFGLLSVLGGCLCLLLPETTGKPLPQSFKEAQENTANPNVPNGESKSLEGESTNENAALTPPQNAVGKVPATKVDVENSGDTRL